jgi:L-2-hydroxyglutarate oxidase
VECRRETGGFTLETTAGAIGAAAVIGCAGLHADRVARLCGLEPDVITVPFRGEYYELTPDRRHLVRNLIYPTPDPTFPFLGVHLTRMVTGAVEVGPNAVLALRREGYRWTKISAHDVWEMVMHAGVRRFMAMHWRTGLQETYRSLSKRAFVRSLQRLVPDIRFEDVRPHAAGVRAMAIDRSGRLVDDFELAHAPGQIHVLNAPSPAATASISIGETIADLAVKQFGQA